MKNIYLITDPKVLAIPIKECNEPLIDLKDLSDLSYGPPPECDLTVNSYTKMRKTLFTKLCRAQQDLPNGWHFLLYEGYRSLDVQSMLFDQEYQRLATVYPEKSHEKIFIEATTLVSPVINLDGSMNIPPHNTGAAVDIEVINAKGGLVDMGMAIRDWSHIDPEICMTKCNKISREALKNRLILLNIMEKHGFVNYPTEWWHYSYGDRYWAFISGKKYAIYGSINTTV